MRKPLLTLLLSIPFLAIGQGTLVEDTVILHLTYNDLDQIMLDQGIPLGLLATDYEVDVHRVIYNTPDVVGQPTTASGLIFIPSNDTCAMPMMTYLHGTKLERESAFYHLNGEWQIGAIAATSGYAACLPDYLGLGAGPGIHPYMHGESEATASIDCLRACRFICDSEDRNLNDQLFITGYSQGGHSTMAVHRKIQEELSGELTVTASAPGSGPYDMSGIQLDMVASFDPYSEPGYLPFLIQSYQAAYGDLYTNIEDIYVAPYDQILPPLLDGSVGMGVVNDAMPAVPRDIFTTTYTDAFFSDTTHPAFVALKANNMYDWVPEAPVTFSYCRMDEQVAYENTFVASNYMINNGSPAITVIERDSLIGHFDCALPSILGAKIWFDGMANLCDPSYVGISEEDPLAGISIFPNPISSGGSIRFANSEPITVSIHDVSGRLLVAERLVQIDGSLELGNFAPGILVLRIESAKGMGFRRLVIE